MTVIAGRLWKHLAIETIGRSIRLVPWSSGREAFLTALLVWSMGSSTCWASGSSYSSWFLLFKTWSWCRGSSIQHLLFLVRCHKPPGLVHQILCCLFVARCHQDVVYLIGPVHPGFCCWKPSHNALHLHCCICCLLSIVVDHLTLHIIPLVVNGGTIIEGPDKATRRGGGVNGSQSKFLEGTLSMSQNQPNTPSF
jgi:hypothetical protein